MDTIDKPTSLTQENIMKFVEWLYTKSVEGMPGFDSVQKLVADYTQKKGETAEDPDYAAKEGETLEEMVDRFIRWQTFKAGLSGGIAGLGGMLTMPVLLPANITSVMLIQVRMILAIAIMGGYDIRSDQVKTVCFTCLAGNAAKDILKASGIMFGTKISQQVIKSISFEMIKSINKALGFRFITKFGKTGVINLGKGIPLAGGIIGGLLDGGSTYKVGHTAKSLFIGDKKSKKDAQAAT